MKIGASLKRLRLARRLSLKDVAEGAGLTASMISQVENDLTMPSLPSLDRLLAFYRIRLTEFFDQIERERCIVCRAGELQTLEPSEGVTLTLLASKLRRTTLESVRLGLEPGALFRFSTTGPEGEGERFLLVESGEVAALVDGERFLLATGDSLNFKSVLACEIRNDGASPARAFANGVPPLFLCDTGGRQARASVDRP